MKVLRSAIGLMSLIIILFSLEANFASCKKQVIRDTVIVKDTITIKDTVHIVDSSTCSCYDLTDGLIAYYNFNGGNLNDSSGNNNHITLNNGAVKAADRFGRANNAYQFDGTSNYMRVENSASLNTTTGITITATVKINGFYSANCVQNQIVGKGWNDFINGFYALRFYSTVGCGVAADTSKEVLNGSYGDNNARSVDYDTHYIHTGRWYNFVYTSADGVSKMYIDGVLQSTGATAPSVIFTPNSQEMYIGKHGDPQYPYYFNGVIDEIRIYKKALCDGAIKQLNASQQ